MKLNAVALVLLGLSPTIVFAGLGDPGFSGHISVVTGQKTVKSNFQTEDSIKTGSLNTEGESDTSLIVVPLGYVRYTFGASNSKQLFAGTSKQDIAIGDLALEIGYKQELKYGTIVSFAFLPTVIGGETWADPFVTGVEREETDIEGNAYLVSANNISGTHFSVDFGVYNLSIDDEKSGLTLNKSGLTLSEVATLDREGTGIYSKFSYEGMLGDAGSLITAVKYISFDADGSAISFDQWGMSLTFQKTVGQHKFWVTASYDKAIYDEVNPIFNKKQKDDKFGTFVAYEYDNFMNLANWSLIGVVSYDVTGSSMDFYDEQQYITSVGMSYKF